MAATCRIGDTEVYPIGLGCMNLNHAYGPPTPPEEASKLLNQALDEGCNFLDTATMYGAGENEKLIAASVGHRRKEYFLASKCVAMIRDGKRVIDGRPEAIKQACDASLQRLGTDVIDLYYMHRPDPDVAIEESVGAMAELVEAGKVRYLGLSEANAEQIRAANGVYPITALQSEYSLWERYIEPEILPTCRELGIGIVPYSPLGRGFLTGQITSIDDLHEDDWRRGLPRFQGENFQKNLDLVEIIVQMAEDKGCTAAQIALAWVLAQGEDVVPIPGTKHIEYLQDNVKALDIHLTPEEVEALSEAIPRGAAVGARYPTSSSRVAPTPDNEDE